MAVLRRNVQVVKADDNGQAFVCAETPHKVQDFLLMIDVEIGGWLVKEQDIRFLGQGAGNGEFLQLSAGKPSDPSLCKVGGPGCIHDLPYHGEVLFSFGLQESKVRRATHQDQFKGRDHLGQFGVLRRHRHEACSLS